jgi:signal transduction histidine kinase/CheY-like chemotaxis protein
MSPLRTFLHAVQTPWERTRARLSRLLPDISYGTERYPEKFARRLRALNITVWIVAAATACFTVTQLIDPRPGMWKLATLNAIAVPLLAAIPLLHRFGKLAAPVGAIILAFVYFSSGVWLLGTGTGMLLHFPVLAALALLIFGLEHLRLAAGVAVAACITVITLQVLVPDDTGIQSAATRLVSFAVAMVLACSVLPLAISYVLSATARAEAELAREHEVTQDKSHQLEIANKYKAHFLASASHDLRQPLHALNLFVGQLHRQTDPAERARLVGHIDAAVTSMNELFGAMLDMTRLDAGILEPHPAELPAARLLDRIDTTFAAAAGTKGLRLRVVPSKAWVRSDPLLLERILLNLVSNAVRYTVSGGVVVGCRRRGEALRIDVCDSGPGIPEDERERIFAEFDQVADFGPERRNGLGLAIVDRFARLLGHAVELDSRPGHGSRFSVTVPLLTRQRQAQTAIASRAMADPLHGKRVMVIDNDLLVLDGMRGILQSWGCEVLTASSGAAALASLAADGRQPELIIADYSLSDGTTGIAAIERLRTALDAPVPAFIITGDTAPERLREVGARGFRLLHKPVSPMALRATLNGLVTAAQRRDLIPES